MQLKTAAASITVLPNKHLPVNLKQAVALLRKPYTPISQQVYEEIADKAELANTDIVLFKGKQVTFGMADGGYALMPLSKQI